MVEWMEDLERRVDQRGAAGATTAERVYDVLRRAVPRWSASPSWPRPSITALTSDDREPGARRSPPPT